jgi:hypothetical protein
MLMIADGRLAGEMLLRMTACNGRDPSAACWVEPLAWAAAMPRMIGPAVSA